MARTISPDDADAEKVARDCGKGGVDFRIAAFRIRLEPLMRVINERSHHLSSTLRIFGLALQTPAQKIDASEMMRTACLTDAAVRPKGPNGTHRSFHSDQ